MITSKRELKEYLMADRTKLGFSKKFPSILGNEIWKFEISLRYYEFYYNDNNMRAYRGFRTVWGVMKFIWKTIYHHYSIKLGFDIPPNTCGKGLNIHHWGCVVINGNARIGENCNIQQCVNIGQNYSSESVPTIGNNVYICPGAKIFGKIIIAPGCAIGAGSVVNKSFMIKNRIIAGNSARDVGERKIGLN